ncbi:diguanylate cyclase [Gynuella sp.]|uniref:sensor domain-containing diguanylate cyclase n=1 Tax=Gynuella sp. TaxID=2969146 RepID=UPI003D0FBE46
MSDNSVREFHWIMDMIQNIDVGLVVLDKEYRIEAWNGFMENHSGLASTHIKGKNLFTAFPDIDEEWFRDKAETVFQLKNRAFTTWEQRPYLFKFKNYQPITGTAEYMFQNTTLLPLTSVTGEVDHISMLIYDVTDIAVNREQLKSANRQLRTLSRSDRLTGLYNRGYWEELMRMEFLRARRSQTVSTLMILDIDHFKNVNDVFGHQVGDQVIRLLASNISSSQRVTDISGRYGGEEFVVILVDTDPKHAMISAERLRQKVESLSLSTAQGELKFTISIGLCGFRPEFESHEEWIVEADKALYESKHNGRNQTTIAG